MFLGVGQEKSSNNVLAPDGNTLLHMFGPVLFDAALQPSEELQDARAEALSILCKLFTSPQKRKPFQRIYLEQFYYCLSLVYK